MNTRTSTKATAAMLAGLLAFHCATVQAQPKPQATFKDWALACAPPPGESAEGTPEQCYLYQIVSMQETKQRLMHLAVGYVGSQQKVAAVITLPLGILLPPGLAFSIDGGKPTRLPVQTCQRNGCRAVLPLDDALIDAMKKGTEGEVSFVGAGQGEIGIPFSLLGFTAGFNALNK